MKNSKIFGLIVLALIGIIPATATPKATKADSATVVLSKDNVIVLNSEVSGESTAAVIAKAKELDDVLNSGSARLFPNAKPLYLFLNTPGGSIQSGLELIEALNGIGRPVNTITLFSASMGFQIAQNLGERLILKNGVLMSHRATGGFEGQFGGQAPSQIESRYALWKSRLDEMDQQTVSRTGGKQTMESYQKQYASEMWLTGTQSVDQGYADKVVTVKCDKSLSGVTTHSLSFLGIPISYDLDNCPINTSPMNIRVGIPSTEKSYVNGSASLTVTVIEAQEFIRRGGGFGRGCESGGQATLCAQDPYLTLDRINEVKVKFIDSFSFVSKKDKVIPMRW